jgi:hypothetical protein
VGELADARLYLCTDARKQQGDLTEFLDAVLAGGVDVVQLRDKSLEAAEEIELAGVFQDACRRTRPAVLGQRPGRRGVRRAAPRAAPRDRATCRCPSPASWWAVTC